MLIVCSNIQSYITLPLATIKIKKGDAINLNESAIKGMEGNNSLY